MRTANNFGFRMEGQLRSHIFTGGEYVDQWVLGLLKDEYEKISIVSRWKARREN
jgi:RimJ/RimL family protein N-acetyltransferase